MIKLSTEQLAQILQAKLIGDKNVQVEEMNTDTRKSVSNSLFFALKGEKFDAHQYLEQAVAQGAVAVVVQQENSSISVPQLVVKDTRIALGELAKWLRAEEINFDDLEDSAFDPLMGEASGGGIIFGNTGGVMEAAMRAAYKLATGEDAPQTLIPFEAIRGMDGAREADVVIGDKTLHVAAVHGTGNLRKFIERMRAENIHYDFIEVMACRGGCIGGGGQPRVKLPMADKAREARIASLYTRDAEVQVKAACDNPDIQKLYAEFFDGKPMSHKAHHMLHTTFVNRSEDLGPNGACTPATCPTSVPNLKKAAEAAKAAAEANN